MALIIAADIFFRMVAVESPYAQLAQREQHWGTGHQHGSIVSVAPLTQEADRWVSGKWWKSSNSWGGDPDTD